MMLLGGQSRQETLGCVSCGEKLGPTWLLLVYHMSLGKQEPEFHSINKLILLLNSLSM